jgi:hypothetical protein
LIASGDTGDQVTLLDYLALFDREFLDDPRALGEDRDLHLHRFEHHEGVALGDDVTPRGDHLHHVRDHLGAQFFGHSRLQVSGAPISHPGGRLSGGQTTTVLFVIGAVLGGVLVGMLLGGSLYRLERLALRHVSLLGLAVVVQVIASLLFGGAAYVIGLVLSLLLATAFVARNPHLAGRGLLVGGLALNAAVIIANGAMPVHRAAAARAGVSLHALVADPRHRVEGAGTHLTLLDDRIPLPLPVGAQVLSIGDVLVAAGAGLLIAQAMRRRIAAPAPIAVRPPPAALRGR